MSIDERSPIADHRADRAGGISAAYDDLDCWLIGDEAELPETLADLDAVERTLRAIAWRRRKVAQAEMVANAVIDRTREHLASERTRFDDSFLVDRLRGYHQARLADDDRARTLRFPSGELVARKGQPKWDIDPDVFVPWALSHASALVRTKWEPDKAEAKKALSVSGCNAVTADGEVVPGVIVEPAEVSYTVKAGES